MFSFVFLALLFFTPDYLYCQTKYSSVLAVFDRYVSCDKMGQCRNMVAAIRCNVQSYCVKNEWSKPKVDDMKCKDCTSFISSVADKRNATGKLRRILEMRVTKTYLYTYCQFIKMELELCRGSVRNVLEEIKNTLKDKVTADVYCSLLQLCRPIEETSSSDKDTVDTRQLQEPVPRGPKTCDFCLTVLKKLEMIMPKNKSENFDSKVTSNVCRHLPYTHMVKCSNFMNTTGLKAIDLLYEKHSPDDVCNTLHACSSEKRGTVLPIMECDMCDDITQQLQSAGKQGTGVEDFLSKACNQYSDVSNIVCEDFILSNKPTLSTLLEKQEERDLCEELGFCVREMRELWVRKDECAWDPKLLCSDREYAKRCQAIQYCEEHGWN